MIVDMSLSPTGVSLAAIDVAGNLSIVEVPSFRRKKFWSFKELVLLHAITVYYYHIAFINFSLQIPSHWMKSQAKVSLYSEYACFHVTRQ